MTIPRDEVCILLPTLNESQTIGGVITGFQEQGFSEFLVIDGDSSDRTQEIARDHGARVLVQSGKGKGQAIRQARDAINSKYVLMTDADQTYRPEEADDMLEPLVSGQADHVIGNRFANIHPDAMTRLNQFGNRVINFAFKTAHRHDLQDILSGYRAFTREAFQELYLGVDGFGIETEIAVECVRNDLKTVVVPIHYDPRPDGSETNLSPISHGTHIVATLYRLAKTNNPAFYFGVIGIISLVFGAISGAYVGAEYALYQRVHRIISLVSMLFIILGVQLGVAGLLADTLHSFHKRQMYTMKNHLSKND